MIKKNAQILHEGADYTDEGDIHIDEKVSR